jgi:HAD superfamily hydrolase (TIGR01509 family)
VLPAYRAFAHAEHEHLMKPFPGMPELLRDLESLGIPMALATSKRGLPLRRQLARFGWEAHFDPMITPDEVTHGKPHPESLEKCLAHHRLQPGDALMVGDTPFDLEMAERAGVPSVAVGHGFYGQAALAAFHPLAYAPDTATLREILLAMAEAPGEMI